jgi:hypothetical protein
MFDTGLLEQTDFSGGVTDNTIGSTSNKYAAADNLLITASKKLQSRAGSALDNTTAPLIPAGQQRIGTLINYNNDENLLVQSGKNIYVRGTDGEYDTVVGPTGNSVFANTGVADRVSYAQWNKHVVVCSTANDKPQKIFRDGNTFKCLTCGLPGLASEPIIAGQAGENTYLYGFLLWNSYDIDGTTFEDFGPTTVMEASSIADPSVNNVTISNIPVLSNGLIDNYDTAKIRIKIYRTIAGGTSMFFVGEVINGTTSFVDNVGDTNLQSGEPIYTTGQILDNDPPPIAKYVHITNGVAYYAVGNQVFQAVSGDVDSCPVDLFSDLDEDITGISSINGVPIVFGKRRIWRLEGIFDELGSGQTIPQKISDTAGCLNHNSIVQTNAGLFWFGVDGIYFTNGYQISKVNDDRNESYAAVIATDEQKKNVYGMYDRETNRVWWSIQKDQASLDADSCEILDLRWGIRADSTFTTASGGDSFAPTALCIFKSKLYRADKRGYVFIHDSKLTSDPKVDVFTEASLWNTQPIIYDFKSISYDFGTASVRKYVSKIILVCKNESNLSLAVKSINDENRITDYLIPVRFRGNLIWGDPNAIWGDTTMIWNFDQVI